MKNTIWLLMLLAVSNLAGAVELTLVADNTRSSSGTLSTQVYKECTPPSNVAGTGCSTFTTAWEVDNGVTGSTATWDWDGTTLAATGMFQSTSHLSSAPAGPAVVSDKAMNLNINTAMMTTTATSYNCIEGNFLVNVGAQGCANTLNGTDFTVSSFVTYNVGDNAACANRTIGGDDTSGGNARGLTGFTGGGGCDATDGAFDLWTVVTDDTGTGGQLILSNGIDIGAAGTHFMTFQAAAPVADAVDDDGGDVLEATATPINVGANDVNFTDPVTVTVTTPGTKGTATVTSAPGAAAGQTISYTSDAGATGTDTFVYTVVDAGTVSDTATVTVNIIAFGANDDGYTTTRGVALTGLTPAANDLGFTPDTVTVTAGVCTSGDGTITVTAGNGGPKAGVLVTYTPPANNPASGSSTALNDSCEYTIGNGTQPNDTANILVAVSNSVPVANDGNASAISTAGAAPAGLTATFTSPGTGGNLGNAGVTAIATQGTKGTAAVVGNVITYTVTDPAFFAGSDTFTYTITDADGDASDETDTGTVTVTIADVNPEITVGTITTTVDTASAALVPTIVAGNGSPAQHTLEVTNGTNGSCVVTPGDATGTVVYTPNAGYTGADTCTLTLTDANDDEDMATINITVNAAAVGGGGVSLPGGGGALDLWSLSLLGGLVWLRRKKLLLH